MNTSDGPYLRYGDYILAFGCYRRHKNDEIHGVLSSIGFTDTRVFLQTLPFNLTDPQMMENPDTVALIRNYREFIFQIWPKLNYEAHKEHQRHLKDKPKFESLKFSEKESDQKHAQEYEATLKKLHDRAVSEHKLNHAALGEWQGNPVQYGVEIVLMHADSESFLSGKSATSDSELSAYKIELSENYDSAMLFKIQPKFKAFKEGSPVQYDDEVYLQNVKRDCYVNFSIETPIDLDLPIKHKSKIPVSPYKTVDPRKIDINSMRYEAHLSQYQETSWKLYLHNRPQEKLGVHFNKMHRRIQGGDLIRLRQPETRSCIAADFSYLGQHNEVYLRNYKGSYQGEESAVNEIWEIEKISLKERGGDITTRGQSWDFEKDAPTVSEFKLRHFLTGRLMVLTDINLQNQRKLIPILAPEYDEKSARSSSNSVFFVPTVFQNHDCVNNGSSYGIAFQKNELFLTSAEDVVYILRGLGAKKAGSTMALVTPRDSATDIDRVKQTSIPNFFTSLKENEFEIDRKAISLEVQKSAQHAFYVERISHSEQKDILFVASAITRLQHFRECVKARTLSSLPSDYLRKMIKTLSRLLLFLVETPKDVNIDPFTYEGVPIPTRQKLMKDMFVIDMLTDILYYPFELGLCDLSDINNEHMLQIFQLSYRLIKFAIRNCPQNEVYAAQWLELFIHQTLSTSEHSNIYAGFTLKELIDNNRNILENRISLETTTKFIENLKAPKPHKRFIILLRSLAVCDGEPLIGNQETISRLIFLDENTFEHICYRVEKRVDKKLYIMVTPYKKWVLLEQFQQEDDKQIYEYFLSSIELFADLCLSRNVIAIERLQEIYTKEIFYDIISSTQGKYDSEMRRVFSKLFTTIWIDRFHENIDLPNYLFTWDEINPQNCQDLFRYNEVSNDFDAYKEFLQQHFNFVAANDYLKAYEKEKNLLTLALLGNLKSLIQMGFYSSMKELERILLPLIKILNSSKDVTFQSEEKKRFMMIVAKFTASKAFDNHRRPTSSVESRYVATPETTIVMRIKIRILQIVDLVLNYFNDYRVRKVLLKFKKSMEAPGKKSAFSDQQDAAVSLATVIEELYADQKLMLGNYSEGAFKGILIDLLLYQNPELQVLAFQVLYKKHHLHESLKEILQGLHLVYDRTAIRNIETIKTLGRKIRELSESVESWHAVNTGSARKQSDMAVLTIMKLTDLLTCADTVDMLNSNEPEEEAFTSSDPQANDMLERNLMPDHENQRIMRHLHTYKYIIHLLDHDLKCQFGEPERSPAVKKVLKACIKFLARFVAGEKTNQRIIAGKMSILMKHLKLDPELGVESVMSELFHDNKVLLHDLHAIENYLNAGIKLIEDLPNSDYNRGKMLFTFTSLMKYCGSAIKSNQTHVLNALFKKEFKTLFYDFSKPKAMDTLMKELAGYENQLIQKKNIIVLSGELDYLCTLLDTLSVATEGKNSITESKCQALFPLETLKELYALAKECYMLKFSIVSFFYHSYIDTEYDLTESDSSLNELIKYMADDLSAITSDGWRYEEIRNNQGTFLAKNLQMRLIMEGFLTVMTGLVSKRIINELKDFPQSVSTFYYCFRFISREIKSPEQQEEVQKLLALIQKHQKHVVDAIELDQIVIPTKERDWDLKETVSPKRYSVMRQETDRHLLKLDAESVSILSKLSEELKFLDSNEYSDRAEQEFELLLDKIVDIERDQDKDMKLTFEKVIKALIALIKSDHQHLHSNLKAAGLKIFRKVIEREAHTQKPASEWVTADWVKYEKGVIERQNQLADYGVVDLICRLMSRTNSRKITQECLLLSIALLAGGNKRAQTAFLSYLRNDSQNEFLLTVKANLSKEIYEVKKFMETLKIDISSLDAKELAGLSFAVKRDNMTMNKGELAVSLRAKAVVDSPIQAGVGANAHKNYFMKEAKESLSTIVKYFRLLQLYCEGHNLDFQNHLRVQTYLDGEKNYRSFDFLSQSGQWFGSLIRYLNSHTIPYCSQLLDFLIEAVQGPCIENQHALVQAKIIYFCIEFGLMLNNEAEKFRRGFQESDEKELDSAIIKSIKLLYSLLEGNNDQKILNELSSLLDIHYLVEKLTRMLRSYCKETLRLDLKSKHRSTIIARIRHQGDTFDDEIVECFNIFILIQTLADNNEHVRETITKGLEGEFTWEQRNAYLFFEENKESIEVVFNGTLIRVYFPVPPIAEFLTEATKEKFMWSVPRESHAHTEKVSALLGGADDLIDEMQHLGRLSRWKVKISAKTYHILKDTSTIFAFLINLLILFTYVREFDPDERDGWLMTHYHEYFGGDEIPALQTKEIIKGLSICQIILAFLVFFFFIILRAPTLIRKYWRDLSKRNKIALNKDQLDDQQLAEDDQDIDLEALPTEKTLQLLHRYGPDAPIFNRDGKRDFGNFWTKFVYYSTNVNVLMADSQILFVVFYLFISLVGLFTHEIVYCLLLLDVVNRSTDLHPIVTTIRHNVGAFVSTAFLWLILIYMFSLFGIWFLDDIYRIAVIGPHGERACSNMLQCFIMTIDYGTRIDAGIGEHLDVPSYDPHSRVRWYVKIIWEFIYFVVINCLTTEAVFAIIVEGFAETRKETEKIEEDMADYCFICNLEQSYVDKHGDGGWDKHVKTVHNPWNYLYYLFMLKNKDQTDFNGIESYIYSKLEADDSISWIPNEDTLDFRGKEIVRHKRAKKEKGHHH